MATADQVISWAASQIGVKESPANSNKVKYWDSYKNRCGVNYQGQPWCASFVTDGMCTCGEWTQTKDEARFRYCPSLVAWAKANGQWLDRKEVCKPGDIILFANKGTACHVGFVEKNLSNSQVQTIEGNTSASSNDNGGAVMRRVRTYGTVGSSWYILGFVRPKYSGSTSGKWEKDNTGWWYKRSDGSYPQSSWVKINNEWYYFNKNGYAVTGWEYIGNKWYYFNKAGQGTECAMKSNGWYKDEDGKWYWLRESGAMVSDGWIQDTDKKWYYFGQDGAMVRSTAVNWKGKTYLVGPDGAMLESTSVVIDPDGALKI